MTGHLPELPKEEADDHFRRVMGYQDLWQLATCLDVETEGSAQVKNRGQAA